MDQKERKLALPDFLKILTSNNVPVQMAMAVASKVYKEFNTTTRLAQLTDAKLIACGVENKETRKTVLTAIRKAGYYATQPSLNANRGKDGLGGSDVQLVAGPSQPRVTSTMQTLTTPPTKKKRKRDDDLNEFIPEEPSDEAAACGSLEFNEVLDEAVLKTKSTVVNRAPLMTAWATVVAEHLGFNREEALSIASVYTEMNAVSKGVSLGLFDKARKKEIEPIKDGAQPYVDLLGRRIPLYQTQSETWRALTNTSPALPSTAYSYISRAFRQTAPHIIGALRLLAESFPPTELNNKGFALYAEFRPDVDGWGKRGEVRCERILSLRKKDKGTVSVANDKVVKSQDDSDFGLSETDEPQSSTAEVRGNKKARTLTVEEYEATLDQDTTFDGIELNFEL